MQERRLSAKDIRFLYMAWVMGPLRRQSETCPFFRGFHVIRGFRLT